MSLIDTHIRSHNCDFIGLTETWLTDSERDKPFFELLTPPGYRFHHVPSTTGHRGGGVGLLYRSTLKATAGQPETFESFEILEVKFMLREGITNVVVIYRPPPSRENRLTVPMFFDDLSTLLEKYVTIPGDLILVGDFNIHYENLNDPGALRLRELLRAYNMTQHVQEATHTCGHILDLCVTRHDSRVINATVEDLISDHHLVKCTINVARAACPREERTYREIRAIDPVAFSEDLQQLSLLQAPSTSLDELVVQYHSDLRKLLDQHAPLMKKCLFIRPRALWLNSKTSKDLQEARQRRRQLERKWRQSRLPQDYKNIKINAIV